MAFYEAIKDPSNDIGLVKVKKLLAAGADCSKFTTSYSDTIEVVQLIISCKAKEVMNKALYSYEDYKARDFNAEVGIKEALEAYEKTDLGQFSKAMIGIVLENLVI